MKHPGPLPPVHSHLLKLGEGGLLTLALPDMKGRYVMIEQRDGCVTITPFDLECAPPIAVIATHSGQAALIGACADGSLPQA